MLSVNNNNIMPLKLSDIEQDKVPISFLKDGEVMVRVGPSSSSFLSSKKIPLDGRRYVCAGTIILKNGMKFRANFEIKTYTFDFLDRESVYIFIDEEKAWYSIDEETLYDVIHMPKEIFLSYQWLPDRPLDYFQSGPYPMKW